MKAAVLTTYGDPATGLEYRDVPEPKKPGVGQVLVGAEFAPINFSDILVARGLYPLRPDLPSVIGNEGVGRVLEIGQQVGDLRVGARVALPIGHFVWRERMVLPATALILLPEDGDPRQLAMVSINPPSAHLLLEKYLDLQQGDWIAMNAANSSIARWIIGFATQKGLRTLGLARRARVLDEVRAAGCDLSLLDDDNAPSKMADALGKVRPRLALDAIGGDASGATSEASRARRRLCVICRPELRTHGAQPLRRNLQRPHHTRLLHRQSRICRANPACDPRSGADDRDWSGDRANRGDLSTGRDQGRRRPRTAGR
jgi:NADPH:quinone reductase-like Zn-dependent oxidoreductase